jgi:hypothetical protein
MSKLHSFRQAAFAITIAATLGSASAAGVSDKELALIGQPAPAATSVRVIDLNTSSYANIAYGETVVFRGNGGNQFAWTFNGVGGRSWDLAKIAPAGFSDKQYRVYVSRNPLYRS